ncbi:MAG: GntR family transcriptional regulator [Stappiaceae bacterium]
MLKPNVQTTLSPRYYKLTNQIREDLVRGEFQPGQRMKMNELAVRYDTGPNTVREALQQLSGEGWIILEPNKGAVVRPLTSQVIKDIYEMREVLEICTARKFVDNASNNHLKELSDIQDRFEEAAKQSNFVECSLMNSAFHRYINHNAGNHEITETVEKYSRLMGSIRRYIGYGDGRADQVAKEHRDLINAFQQRDANKAAGIISAHLKASCVDILEHYLAAEDLESQPSKAVSASA